MNIDVYWGNSDQTVMVMEAVQEWSWEDYYAARDQMQELLHSVDHPIDVIIDSSKFGLPSNAMSNFTRHSGENEGRIKHVFLVSSNGFMIAMFKVFARLFPNSAKRVMIVKTLDEAWQGVHERSHSAT